MIVYLLPMDAVQKKRSFQTKAYVSPPIQWKKKKKKRPNK